MSVVFDSGIWVSALQFGGVPMNAIARGLISETVVTCIGIEEEIVRTLEEKFHRSAEANRARLSILLQGTVRVSVGGTLAGVCRDPNDDFIVECAMVGDADLIVTGDKDLLVLGGYGSIRILTPRQYLDLGRQP